MGLTSVYFTPHGMQLIPGLEDPYNAKFGALHTAMAGLQGQIRQDSPDLILAFTPHGYQLPTAFSLYYSESYRSYLPVLDRSNVDGSKVHSILEYPASRPFLDMILRQYTEDGPQAFDMLPLTLAGPSYPLPLAWGSGVPLYYCHDARGDPIAPVVVVSLPRHRNSWQVSQPPLEACGRFFAELIASSPLQISAVFSGDLAHTHATSGTFKYHPASKEFDAKVCEWINNFTGTRGVPEELYQLEPQALACGLSTLTILDSLLARTTELHPRSQWKGSVLGYGAPTYFGMAVAQFLPKKTDPPEGSSD